MYRRKINELKKWKMSQSRKPLVFLGARKVDKTWLIREFGESEYKPMAYVNFEHPNAPKGITSLKYFNENASEYQIIAASTTTMSGY